jgi:hypothetical protein
VTLWRKIYGDEHPATSKALLFLASCLHHDRNNVSAAQWKEAEDLYRKALDCLQVELKQANAQEAVGARTREIRAQAGLGDVISAQERPAEAVTWYEKALENFEKFQADFPDSAKNQPFIDRLERARLALQAARMAANSNR